MARHRACPCLGRGFTARCWAGSSCGGSSGQTAALPAWPPALRTHLCFSLHRQILHGLKGLLLLHSLLPPHGAWLVPTVQPSKAVVSCTLCSKWREGKRGKMSAVLHRIWGGPSKPHSALRHEHVALCADYMPLCQQKCFLLSMAHWEDDLASVIFRHQPLQPNSPFPVPLILF